jgi:hypothetical protein
MGIECPLKKIRVQTEPGEYREYFDNCQKSACMWYIEETGECAIKCIATRLERGAVHVVWEKQLQPAL